MSLVKGDNSSIDNSNIYAYIVPFAFYVFLAPLLGLFYKNDNIILLIKVIVVLLLLLYYRQHYKFKFLVDFFILAISLIIVMSWIGLEGLYPLLGHTSFIPQNTFFLIIRIISAIVIAPIIEEFFVRYFLNRIIINRSLKKWNLIPVYKFSITSFVITVLFFGFSHNRWLPGIITGILLNLVLMKTKRIDYCVVAHIIANIVVVLFILLTQSWNFW